jgi:hypothetical protein
MKIILATVSLMFALTSFAQTTVDTKAKPEAEAPTTTAQKQEQGPAVDNNFMTGPYNPKGEYIFFDRAEREKREADEEMSEEQM